MQKQTSEIQNIVFITHSASSAISIPSDIPFQVCVADSSEIIRHFLPYSDKPLAALIFCDHSEIQILSHLISMFNKPNFTYFFAAHISGKCCDIPAPVHVTLAWEGMMSEKEFRYTTQFQFRLLEHRLDEKILSGEYLARLLDMKQDQEDLIKIGRSLTLEKDMSKLLRQILMLSKKITGADAGSIYLIEEENGTKQIRFKFSHTFSKDLPLEEFTIPFNTKSIAGYVAVTGKVLNISDVYKLSPDDPISFNKQFDIANTYRSKSMLVVPMRNHVNEIIGVIQLINSKEPLDPTKSTGNEAFEITLENEADVEKLVCPFDRRYESLMESVAAQAAIAIENNRMIEQIRYQFEEFVKASVTAIESRDPATSGHSFRVSEICKRLARAVNNDKKVPFSGVHFSETQIKELEFAALLHDFGKVYIDPGVFMKAKKLYPFELQNLILKINYLYRNVELEYTKNKYAHASDEQSNPENFEKIETEKNRFLDMILEIKNTLVKLNEPSISDDNPAAIVDELNHKIAEFQCYDIEGKILNIFTEDIVKNLSIKRGSLNDTERKEIESHVLHTYNFVSKIPWPPEFKHIPDISLMHHEKLDGTGYPHGKKNEEIPLQAKIMAIADIYDALTATDRPYKKALSHEKAIEILRQESERNKIDPSLFDLFAKSGITIDEIKKARQD